MHQMFRLQKRAAALPLHAHQQSLHTQWAVSAGDLTFCTQLKSAPMSSCYDAVCSTHLEVLLMCQLSEVLHRALFTWSSNLWHDKTYSATYNSTHLEVLLVLLLCRCRRSPRQQSRSCMTSWHSLLVISPAVHTSTIMSSCHDIVGCCAGAGACPGNNPGAA